MKDTCRSIDRDEDTIALFAPGGVGFVETRTNIRGRRNVTSTTPMRVVLCQVSFEDREGAENIRRPESGFCKKKSYSD